MIGVLRRNRALTGILGALLVLLVGLTALTRDGYSRDDLHPQNPDPNGARALARVLADRGIEVTVAHDQAELLALAVGGDTTVVVSSTRHLGRRTARTLLRHAGGAGVVVLALPPAGLLPGLEVAEHPVQGSYAAGCTDPLLQGLAIDVRRSPAYRLPGGSACFRDGAHALVVRTGSTYVVGAGDLLSNQRILEADNAAVALRLLGQHPRVVWYVPDPADLSAGEGTSLSSLLPRWLMPSLILLGAAAVGLVLWRGRRLGPLAVEPLPVVVRNSEAVEARGRLYRRSADREHAARVLRRSTVERLATHLALPPAASTDLVVHEVAVATGRPAGEIAGILQHDPVRDDAGLVALATALGQLELPFGTLARHDKEEGRP